MAAFRTNFHLSGAQSSASAKPLSREVFNSARPQLFPTLRIEASPQLLASRKIRFQEETDDLDDYRVSRFQVDGVLALLQRYATSERNQLNLFVDMKGCLAKGQSPADVSSNLLNSLGLGEVNVIWTNSKLQSQFAELLQKAPRAVTRTNRSEPASHLPPSVRSKEKKPSSSVKPAVRAHSY